MQNWHGKKKAVTFSYDDGVESDVRLLSIFNRYGMKATFNLNSGLLGTGHSWIYKDFEVKRLPLEGLRQLYQGHEIAVHGTEHLHPTELTPNQLQKEFAEDKKALERIFSVPISGMAYSFGEYDERVIEVLKENGIRYARTVEDNHSFDLQHNLLTFHPTCHHSDPAVFELIDRFLRDDSEKPQLLYIWGHAYEFDGDGNWERIEEICRKLCGHSDVFYGTNAEVLL